MSKEEKKSSYVVHILRTDGAHISAITTPNYDEAYELWQKLSNQWTETVKDQRPFIIEAPMVTSFAPQLIYEITLVPVVETAATSRHNNPYQNKMMANGLSAMNQSDVLDNGYKG